MRKHLATILAVGLVLGGCASTTPQQLATADNDKCIGYGFKEGTDAYAECRMNVDQARQANRRAMIKANTSYKPYMLEMPATRNTLNCTTYGQGQVLQTNCR